MLPMTTFTSKSTKAKAKAAGRPGLWWMLHVD